MDPSLAVEITGLRKDFGGFAAVDGLDLRIRKGEIYGLLGPNGAGKTTTIRMICGLMPPTSGEVLVWGHRMPGERNVKVFVKISNNGSQTAEQLRLSLVSGYVTGSTSTLVGSLPGGSSKIVMMEVDIDPKVSPGDLEVDVELSWVQDGRQLSSTSYRHLQVAQPQGISPLWYAAAAAAAALLAIASRKRLRPHARRQ